MIRFNILLMAAVAFAATNQDSFKDQYCTDPRTMRKHAAYSEWADAYSCTRHRCQPGGRNLAIYTVGCKRVEAPESAIECEEVVEDTNMQFPFCCTRLRCLVVVRGEVWTRVLGQPWETLPAAPWSHMYKMKKPPPPDGSFLPKKSANAAKMLNPAEGEVKSWDDATGLNVKLNGEGPIYELTSDAEDTNHDKVLRSAKATPTEAPDCNDVIPRSGVVAPAPDIVIALSTNEANEHKKTEGPRHKKKKTQAANLYLEEPNEQDMLDGEDNLQAAEKQSLGSEEQVHANTFGVTQKIPFKAQEEAQSSWTEVPQSQHEHSAEKTDLNMQDFGDLEGEKKEEKPSNLQALVDAIGTRMRDIENVVQKMSEKVHQKPGEVEGSGENNQRFQPDADTMAAVHHEEKDFPKKAKKSNRDEQYTRFSVRNRGSKYLHTTEGTTDLPLFIEDTNMNGYFSDASNTVLRRAHQPKEPAAIYMAPVDTRRKGPGPEISLEEETKKRKKHTHKKKKSKGRNHKKHHGKDEKRKKFNKLTSIELDKNMVSLEDSSVL